MNDEQYFPKAIEWAEKQGFSDLKANFEGYDQPTNFKKANDDQPFIPDITGKKADSKYYVEIATKTNDITRKISKWKLLSTLAAMKGGKLYLLAPKGHKSFVEKAIDEHNLGAELLYLGK